MCSSVCLSVLESIFRTTQLNVIKFILLVTYGRVSIFLWRRCDKFRASVFMDDNGDAIKAYTESDSTGGSTSLIQRRILKLTHEAAAPCRPRTESDIYDCLVYSASVTPRYLLT